MKNRNGLGSAKSLRFFELVSPSVPGNSFSVTVALRGFDLVPRVLKRAQIEGLNEGCVADSQCPLGREPSM